ncbi:ATP-binding cassette domain-containing protein [Paenibacillus sp. TRM 82003]|nr:ATP-binding cassette domain-containing protein [Paenibacillus sp. TRM 82003]
MNRYAIQTHRVCKRMKGKDLVTEVSMNVKKGEIYGFLGPNGAGKTTVMRMLLGLMHPTAGGIELFGEPLRPGASEVLKRIGSVIEYPTFYEKLSAKENLELHCEYMGYYKKGAAEDALRLVELSGTGSTSVKDFSLGMKQRLGIARAIATRPELLVLDEPINGLDPVGIREMRSLFAMLSKQYGMTLLVSSHILGEVEQIADTIGVIQGGRLLEEVSMADIRAASADYLEITTPDVQKAAVVLEEQLMLMNMKVTGDAAIRVYDEGASQNEIIKALALADVRIDGVHKKTRSLEDYFLGILEGGRRSA